MFSETSALKKILKLKKRIRAVSGGTGASKTISILCWLIDYCQSTKEEIITVVAESVPHLKLGAIRDFKNIMISNNYWKDDLWNEMGIYSFESGSKLEFISFDKFGKAHGPRRDVLFINEANNIPYNIVDQLITRTRKIVWLDWNPIEDFWFYEQMLGKRDDIDFMGEGGNYPPLTYLDNEQLDETSRKEIEIHKNNKQWWDIYGLGKRGILQGRIYNGWKIIDEIPHEARLERYGLDFGYTNDPTAIVSIWYFNGGYILKEELYRKGMSNKDIANFFQSLPEKLIIADSAEPKSIDELRGYGLNVMPAQKGKDSVRQGIQLIQDQPLSITKRSTNLIKEYRNYFWQQDKNGKILNRPIDFNNHLMDALRYAMVTLARIEPPKTYWDRIWAEELKSVDSPHLKPRPNLGR